MASRVARRSLHNLRSYRLPSTIEEKLCTPALIIYAEHVRWNIARVVEACGSPTRWQPHIKTVKSSWALDALCDAGVRHFKCATSREAELLGSTLAARDGSFEVLVAFPHTGPTLARLGRTAARYAANVAWSVLVEDAAGAEGAVDAGLGVYVDVNCGMDRTGTSLDGAGDVLARVRAVAGTDLAGIHMYDGHAASLGDTADARNAALFPLYDELLALDGALDLITAGTPALLPSLAHAGLRDSGRHRVSAGTVVLSDTRAEASAPWGCDPLRSSRRASSARRSRAGSRSTPASRPSPRTRATPCAPCSETRASSRSSRPRSTCPSPCASRRTGRPRATSSTSSPSTSARR